MTVAVLAETIIAAPSLRNPRTLVFFIAALLLLGLAVLAVLNDQRWELSRQRRVYWAGTFGAALCALLAGLPDWVGGLEFAAGVVLLMAMNAYFLTSYIKLGGRVFALHLRDGAAANAGSADGLPADAYGGNLSAPKMWWMMVIGLVICSVNVVGRYGASLIWIAFAAPVVVLPIGFGYLDAAAGQRFARGQFVQFGIITVVTAGAFAVLYVVGFAVGGGGHRTPNSIGQQSPPRDNDV